jgi:zinc protease
VDPEKLVSLASEELANLTATPPTPLELERAKNTTESGFLLGLEPILARAIKLSMYDVLTGDPDYLAKDLARFRNVTDKDIADFAKKYLGKSQRAVLIISPEGARK